MGLRGQILVTGGTRLGLAYLNRLLGIALVCLTLAVPLGALGQSSPIADSDIEITPNLHWAYASYFGTGRYQINDEQGVFVINTTPIWREGDIDWSFAEGASSHYQLNIPITIGLAQFSFEDIDIPEFLDPDNLSIASLGLSGNLDIPVTEQFSIRPHFQFAHGRIVSTPEYAWTWRGDIRGRYRFDLESVDLSMIGAAGAVGYDGNDNNHDEFVFTELGLEMATPVDWFSNDGRTNAVYSHIKYTQLPLSIDVQRTLTPEEAAARGGDLAFDQTSNLVEIGLAFGKRKESLRFWFFEFDRIGLALTASPSSELKGIKLVVESLYEP